jgi:hypothetical protein
MIGGFPEVNGQKRLEEDNKEKTAVELLQQLAQEIDSENNEAAKTTAEKLKGYLDSFLNTQLEDKARQLISRVEK